MPLKDSVLMPAPLFSCPVYDGAADPVMVYHRQEKQWWMFYTQRRSSCNELQENWGHGTDIGLAVWCDHAKEFVYRGVLEGLNFDFGRNTFWAPEVLWHDGAYHMYLSYVQGMPPRWNHPRAIVHYTSCDMLHWDCQGPLTLSSDRVIDACVQQMQNGLWRMWYKDEGNESRIYSAQSYDLFHWTCEGDAIGQMGYEGPNVFWLDGWYWMLLDRCVNPRQGLEVLRSTDGVTWVPQSERILDVPGIRPQDGNVGRHADVISVEGKSYVVYFVNPNPGNYSDGYRYRRSVVQIAPLQVMGERLCCDRDAPCSIERKSL